MSTESSPAASETRQQQVTITDRARSSEHASVCIARRGRRAAAVINTDELDEII